MCAQTAALRADQRQLRCQPLRAKWNQFGGGADPKHVLGHGTVSRPLAARHRDQAAATEQNRVFAAQAFGVGTGIIRRLDQRAQANPDAFDIGAGGAARQIAGRFLQNEIDLLPKWQGFAGQIAARRVGGTQNQAPQPGHDKKHPSIGSFWNHEAYVSRQKRALNHQVHALAGGDQRGSGASRTVEVAVALAQFVHPHPSGIDHTSRTNFKCLSGLRVLAAQARHFARRVNQVGDAAVIKQQRT